VKLCLLVDQLRYRRDRTARFQLIVRIAGGEVVELRHTLENLTPLAEAAAAHLVDVRQDLASDVVLAETRLIRNPSLDVREERAINTTPSEEQDNVSFAARQQRHSVHDGVEDIGG